ncbi:DUF4371 domain-containing protein [Trichonephila clavipes]|nr:DUF4371 domain-containing protein [Trichonephila clavipes]
MELLRNCKEFFNDLRSDGAFAEMFCDAKELTDEIDIPANFEVTQPSHRVGWKNVNFDYEARDDLVEDPKLKFKPALGTALGFKKNLYAHMRTFHPQEDVVISNNQVCGLCKETFRTIVNLHEHLQKKHEVKLNFSSETFCSEEDFLKWEEKIELESRSSFF